MDWVPILAYFTGTVDQELLRRNEYLAAEKQILKAQTNGRLRLSDTERATLGEIGHGLGRMAWEEMVPERPFDQQPLLGLKARSARVAARMTYSHRGEAPAQGAFVPSR